MVRATDHALRRFQERCKCPRTRALPRKVLRRKLVQMVEGSPEDKRQLVEHVDKETGAVALIWLVVLSNGLRAIVDQNFEMVITVVPPKANETVSADSSLKKKGGKGVERRQAIIVALEEYFEEAV